MRGEQVRIGGWIFQRLLHHFQQFLRLVCRNPVEAETGWILALSEKILEKIVNKVSVTVKCHEVL